MLSMEQFKKWAASGNAGRGSERSASEPGFLSERVDAYYRERVEGTWSGGHIMKGREPGEDAVLLMSNDYLDLKDHPEIIEAQVQVLREHGRGLLRSDVFRNGEDALRGFERDLAGLLSAEDTVVCQSGWCANTGLIQAIAAKGTPVYLDMFAHASLWEGVASAGATATPFKHNDLGSLDKLMTRHGPGVVAVDAVYSTSGTLCPLEELVEVVERHGGVLVVDESHSLGVFGAQGEGLVAALGLAPRVHFRTASLSKAFAARGGIVAGSARNVEYFRYEARPAIFSSGILPHEAAAFQATLDVVRREDARRQRVLRNADYLRTRLAALDYNVADSECQIISLVAGPEPETLRLRDALEARGVFGAVFCAPATPRNRSLVRFSINAGLERAELDRVASVCAAIREEVGMYEWHSTRRGMARNGDGMPTAATA